MPSHRWSESQFRRQPRGCRLRWTVLDLKALLHRRSRCERSTVASRVLPVASLGFSFRRVSCPTRRSWELRASVVDEPQRGLLVHPRGKPLGQQPPSPMVLIDLADVAIVRAGEPRAPKDAARKRRPALDCSRPPALFSSLREEVDTRGTVTAAVASKSAPSHLRHPRVMRAGPEGPVRAQRHTVAISWVGLFRVRIASDTAVGTEVPTSSRSPCDAAAMQRRIDFLAACRPATPSPVWRQPGLSNGRTDRCRWNPTGPDGKPSGSSATHASCLSRRLRASSGPSKS